MVNELNKISLPIIHDENSADITVENIDQYGVNWRRTGSCNRCGECCNGNPFNEDRIAQVEGTCPLFSWESLDIGKCNDRKNSYYLGGCKVYPQFPQQIIDYPLYSYKFERVEK
jgi:hypothetical protein